MKIVIPVRPNLVLGIAVSVSGVGGLAHVAPAPLLV